MEGEIPEAGKQAACQKLEKENREFYGLKVTNALHSFLGPGEFEEDESMKQNEKEA